MKVFLNSDEVTGPITVLFIEQDYNIVKLKAIESPEGNGVYWLNQKRELVAVEFDSKSSRPDKVSMTIPETNQTVTVDLTKEELGAEISSIKQPA